MAVAYETISSYAFASSGGPHVVTKPIGLAVGDLMVAGFASIDAFGAAVTKSGWTSQVVVSGGTAPIFGLTVLTKTADSADVAASDFSFTGTYGQVGGFLLRISSPGTTNVGLASTYSSINAGTHSFSGFTPTKSDCLYVFFGYRGTESAGAAMDITSVSIATDNPTWTERAQITESTIDSLVFATYTASRSQSSATGNVTFNFTNVGSGIATAGVLMAISPQVNGTFAATAIKTNAYALTPIPPIKVNAYAVNPTGESGRTPTQWSTENKPSTTWANPNK